MSEKHYPTDLDGKDDAGRLAPYREPKPCAKRIDHANEVLPGAAVTWCTLPSYHSGQCSGPTPRVLEPNDLGPQGSKRRRW